MHKIGYTVLIVFFLSVNAPEGGLVALPHPAQYVSEDSGTYQGYEPMGLLSSLLPSYTRVEQYQPVYDPVYDYQGDQVVETPALYPAVELDESRATNPYEESFVYGNPNVAEVPMTNYQPPQALPETSTTTLKPSISQTALQNYPGQSADSVTIMPAVTQTRATDNAKVVKATPPNLVSKLPNLKPDFGFVNAKNVDGTLRKVTYVTDANNNIVPQSTIDIKDNSALSGLTKPLLGLL